jgi:hypothetical protein
MLWPLRILNDIAKLTQGGFFEPVEGRSADCARVTASQDRKRPREMHENGASLYLRRFRFGGEKGAAGVCRGCGEPMEIQSKRACNQLFSKKQRLPMKRTL